MQPAVVNVNTSPGTYSITAAKWTDHTGTLTTTHVVHVEPGQTVNLTLSV